MYKLEVKNYSFTYPNESKKALDNIDLSVKNGELLLLCGKSGSGKSTLLRSFKPEVAPVGSSSGEILLDGKTLLNTGDISAAKVGFVFQNPENQIVTDTVLHELAFGLENMGLESSVIRRRVAETANFFGIDEWFDKKVSELSGGQKQILNLAAIVAMQPDIVLLDEPTSQLDPIATKNFLGLISRLNLELGMTVVICEHDLEELLDMATSVCYLEDGKSRVFDSAKKFAAEIKHHKGFSESLPSTVKIAEKLGFNDIPLSVREIRSILKQKSVRLKKPVFSMPEKKQSIISVKDVWLRYSHKEDFVLKGVNIDIEKGEIHSVVGGNGSGKSTLLKALCGVKNISLGKIKKQKDTGRCAMLMQDPKTLFVRDSVLEELKELQERFNYSEADIKDIADMFDIGHLFARHPYDISGGEMQKTALAKILLTRPDILLLDEPTKGFDADFKKEITKYIKALKEEGKTVVIVTHDLDFAARISDRCSFMFQGEIVCTGGAKEFFAGNNYYTTVTNRITRGIENNCVLTEDVEYDS